MASLKAQGFPAVQEKFGNTLFPFSVTIISRHELPCFIHATAPEAGSIIISRFTDKEMEAQWSRGELEPLSVVAGSPTPEMAFPSVNPDPVCADSPCIPGTWHMVST